MDQLDRLMRRVEYIIEVRDARIPLSSAIHQFNTRYQSIPKLLIYNKTDLAELDKTEVEFRSFYRRRKSPC